jgi:hypothetical protein
MSYNLPSIEVPHMPLRMEGYLPWQLEQCNTWLHELSEEIPSAVRWQLVLNTDKADAALVAQADLVEPGALVETDLLPTVYLPLRKHELGSAGFDQERMLFLSALQLLQEQLQVPASFYVLASEFVERHRAGEFKGGMVHVHAGESLLAVVDFPKLGLWIRPNAHYLEFEAAAWLNRPSSANAPPGYKFMNLEAALWAYGRRTPMELLPERYEHQKIVLRRFPRLNLGNFSDEDLAVIAQLRAAHGIRAKELCSQLGMNFIHLWRILMCLFITGAITTLKDPTQSSSLSILSQLRMPNSSPLPSSSLPSNPEESEIGMIFLSDEARPIQPPASKRST